MERKFNLKPSTYDHRDLQHSVRATLNTELLPVRASVKEYDVPTKDQGSIGWCASHAYVSCMELLANKKGSNYVRLSPKYHYYTVRQPNFEGSYPEDSGQTLRNGAKVLNKIGVSPEVLCKTKESSYNDKPLFFANGFAGMFKLPSYRAVLSFDDIKLAVSQGYPVAFGIIATNSIFTPTPEGEIQLSGAEVGGHGMYIVSYDDERINADGSVGAFEFHNSWGNSWGVKGYGWISYSNLTNYFLEGYAVV